jgi:hypothetical protein
MSGSERPFNIDYRLVHGIATNDQGACVNDPPRLGHRAGRSVVCRFAVPVVTYVRLMAIRPHRASEGVSGDTATDL